MSPERRAAQIFDVLIAAAHVLQQARLNTRVDLLNEQTTIDNYERRFSLGEGVFEVDDETTPGAVIGERLSRRIPARP